MEEKENKSIESNISEGMKEIGDNLSSLPHLIIGKKKEEFKEPLESLFNKKETNWINSIQKWGLIFAVGFIILFCIYRILNGWIF